MRLSGVVAIIQEMEAGGLASAGTRKPLSRCVEGKANDSHGCTCACAHMVKEKLLSQTDFRLTGKLQKL